MNHVTSSCDPGILLDEPFPTPFSYTCTLMLCTQHAVDAAKNQNHTYKHSCVHIELLKCQLKQHLFSGSHKDSYSVIFYDIVLFYVWVTVVIFSTKESLSIMRQIEVSKESLTDSNRASIKSLDFLNSKRKVRLNVGAK